LGSACFPALLEYRARQFEHVIFFSFWYSLAVFRPLSAFFSPRPASVLSLRDFAVNYSSHLWLFSRNYFSAFILFPRESNSLLIFLFFRVFANPIPE